MVNHKHGSDEEHQMVIHWSVTIVKDQQVHLCIQIGSRSKQENKPLSIINLLLIVNDW